MYFWKTNKLESDLNRGSLTQNDRYKYLLAFMIITVVCIEMSSYVPELPSLTRLVESSSVFLATILGTMYCYKTNREGDNSDFIDRFICLYLPIFIRLMVFFSIIFSLYMILGFALLGDSFDKFTDSTNWIDVIFIVGFEIIFYWKLSASIRKVAMENLGSEPVAGVGPGTS